MQYAGPTDPEERILWLRARRGVARRHHPDVGGDNDELRLRLDEVDREFGSRRPRPDDPLDRSRSRRPGLSAHRPSDHWASLDIEAEPVLGRRVSRVLAHSRKTVRQTEKAVRRRIPRGWPGARRYIDL